MMPPPAKKQKTEDKVNRESDVQVSVKLDKKFDVFPEELRKRVENMHVNTLQTPYGNSRRRLVYIVEKMEQLIVNSNNDLGGNEVISVHESALAANIAAMTWFMARTQVFNQNQKHGPNENNDGQDSESTTSEVKFVENVTLSHDLAQNEIGWELDEHEEDGIDLALRREIQRPGIGIAKFDPMHTVEEFISVYVLSFELLD